MGYATWTTLGLSVGSGVLAVALWVAIKRWYREDEGPKSGCVATVTGIFIYPIKSCKGISLSTAQVQKWGFRFDRRWLVVDGSVEEEGGEFMTQKKLPRMTQIGVALDEEDGGKVTLTLTAPEMEPITFPADGTGPVRRVRVKRMCGQARDCGDEVGQWLSKFLHREGLQLVHMGDELEGRKMVDDGKWGSEAREGDEVAMADFAPFLLTNEKSMADLQRRLPERSADLAPVTMERFRPNIVVTTVGGAYCEDRWREFSINGIPFRLGKKCGRCGMITLNPDTGVKDDREPMKTLRTYRMDKSDSRQKDPVFGIDVIADGQGRISLGDSVVL